MSSPWPSSENLFLHTDEHKSDSITRGAVRWTHTRRAPELPRCQNLWGRPPRVAPEPETSPAERRDAGRGTARDGLAGGWGAQETSHHLQTLPDLPRLCVLQEKTRQVLPPCNLDTGGVIIAVAKDGGERVMSSAPHLRPPRARAVRAINMMIIGACIWQRPLGIGTGSSGDS